MNQTKIKNYIDILRPNQWYKNLLVFIAVVYSFNLFSIDKAVLSFYGFISLCILSSANYIFNDILDKKNDINNPAKSSRPIASGKISVGASLIIFIFLSLSGLLTAYSLNKNFFFLGLLFLLLTSIYSIFLKKEIFVDILLIAVNFVIRAVSGALIINVYISPWLVLCPFFLSLFLSVGKRRAEASYLGKYASKHRNTLTYYTENITNSLIAITTAIIIITYSFYTISAEPKLLLTLPLVLYAIFRYFYFIYTDSPIARNPELAFKDSRLIASLVLWALITLIALYY